MIKSFLSLIVLTSLLLTSCGNRKVAEDVKKVVAKIQSKKPSVKLSPKFKSYWFDGTAELTSFALEQARYGEIRKGTAVAVFVSEDFSKSKLVKLDNPNEHPDDRLKVLKFNMNKQFKTGIYDYALMQSVFTPFDYNNYPNSLRVTTSNIEWCGQFLTRAQLEGDSIYRVRYNSYFEGEENAELVLKKNLLEDEIWNQIRMDPERLPQGVFEIIPGILTQELVHHELKIEEATGTIFHEGETNTYELNYSSIPRKLAITYEAKFPYKILGWEETFQTVEGWGMESKLMTTKATKISDTKLDYWERKYLKDEILRKTDLGLEN